MSTRTYSEANRMVTKQDVANKAGVSTATVGRVISGKGDVSKEARERVEKAISTLNYCRNKSGCR